MTTFWGGIPPITLSNDDLYKLGQAISGATAPIAPTPIPPPTPTPTPTPTPAPSGTVDVILPLTGAVRLFNSGDVLYRVIVPSNAIAGAYYRFAGSELSPDQPWDRIAVLSANADGSGELSRLTGRTITQYIGIGSGPDPLGYPRLSPGGAYYFRITTPGITESHRMYMDFIKQ